METTVSTTCSRVLVLHVSVWSQCVHKMDRSELAVLPRPSVGKVQQGWQLCCHSPLLTAGRMRAHGLSSPELLKLLQTSLYIHLRASVRPYKHRRALVGSGWSLKEDPDRTTLF